MPSAAQFVALFLAARARRREQWRSPAELKELRGSRLRRLAMAAGRTAYYSRVFREAGLEPAQLADERDLARLPVLEKASLHAAEEIGLLAEPVEGLSPVTTSGSTGQPLRIFRSGRDQAQVSALWARVLHAFGHGPFDSQVNIGTGRSVARSGPVALLRRLGVLPEIHHISSFEPVSRQVEVLRERRPHTFSSYAISLEQIADALLEQGIRNVRPQVVFSAAMPLSDRGRATAEEAFGVAPLDVYVAAELGTIGWECPEERGALHLNDDMQIVEILDDRDRPVPDGETGQVVVTQLCCLAQPLLRIALVIWRLGFRTSAGAGGGSPGSAGCRAGPATSSVLPTAGCSTE